MVEAVPGTRARIVLEAAGQVEGVVRRQGNPVPALIVAAIYPDGTCPTTFATTGPDGSYALDGLAPERLPEDRVKSSQGSDHAQRCHVEGRRGGEAHSMRVGMCMVPFETGL